MNQTFYSQYVDYFIDASKGHNSHSKSVVYCRAVVWIYLVIILVIWNFDSEFHNQNTWKEITFSKIIPKFDIFLLITSFTCFHF